MPHRKPYYDRNVEKFEEWEALNANTEEERPAEFDPNGSSSVYPSPPILYINPETFKRQHFDSKGIGVYVRLNPLPGDLKYQLVGEGE